MCADVGCGSPPGVARGVKRASRVTLRTKERNGSRSAAAKLPPSVRETTVGLCSRTLGREWVHTVGFFKKRCMPTCIHWFAFLAPLVCLLRFLACSKLVLSAVSLGGSSPPFLSSSSLPSSLDLPPSASRPQSQGHLERASHHYHQPPCSSSAERMLRILLFRGSPGSGCV